MKQYKYIIPSLLLVAHGGALADPDGASLWAGDIELGYVDTSGNTDTASLNAKLKGAYEFNRWKNTAELDVLRTEEGDETTADKWFLSDKLDYKFTDSDYAFLYGRYDDDEFDGFEYQFVVSAGYGRKLIDHDTKTLDVEVGPGYRRSKTEDVDGGESGETENETIIRASLDFSWAFSEGAKLIQELGIESGEEATVSRSVTALQTQIIGSLAMKASLTLENTSEVPEGTHKTDRKTALTLVYSF